MFKKLFCTHDYTVLKEIDFKSEFEIVKEAGLVPKTSSSLVRKHTIIYKCAKCGKLKDETYHS